MATKKGTLRVIRAILATVYLVLVILTIPLAFDVGGITCGLSFSLFIFQLYFFLTTLRIITRHTSFQILSIVYYIQHLVLPSLLTLFLSIFQNYSNSKFKNSTNFLINFFKPWEIFIVNATPIFTICEGFCSLLLIQAVGQTTHWLSTHRSDSWSIVSLLASGSIITGALYFLYRIYVLPMTIGLLSASLLGSILTYTAVVGLYGIISGRGSTIESSLIFAYIVRCIYETFPELSTEPYEALTSIITAATKNMKNEIPYLPQQLSDSFSTIVAFLASNVPQSFQTIWDFCVVAAAAVTLPILLNLAYRIGVFYAATRIIPSLQPQPPSTKSIRIIYAYSPCIIIAVYTHLMMQYNGELGDELKIWGWWSVESNDWLVVNNLQFWNWVNMFTTLILYTVELVSESVDDLTTHWKVE